MRAAGLIGAFGFGLACWAMLIWLGLHALHAVSQ